jgi:hypothetical protein
VRKPFQVLGISGQLFVFGFARHSRILDMFVACRPVDPQFANPAAGDYHLTASSPAVDAGTNVGITVDLDGRRRPLLLGYDMGAFEFGRPLYLPLLVR